MILCTSEEYSYASFTTFTESTHGGYHVYAIKHATIC